MSQFTIPGSPCNFIRHLTHREAISPLDSSSKAIIEYYRRFFSFLFTISTGTEAQSYTKDAVKSSWNIGHQPY
jgi:hypothetical protein